MQLLKPYTKEDILKLTRKREGESKLGELVEAVSGSWEEALANSRAKYVIVGIAEDLGVRANYGRAGAGTAFKPALESFLNQQANHFLDPKEILVLGEIWLDDLAEAAPAPEQKDKDSISKLRMLVAKLDERVSAVIKQIVQQGKTPIVIGGGHNNSYGNIKGAVQALGAPINVINCDPHLDFRPLEGRHSGNGFSYAFEEGYISRYVVFAMHEQYNNEPALQAFADKPMQLFYNTYESVFVREEQSAKEAMMQCIDLVRGSACGIELDLDAITNVPSSAKTSSGISPLQARQFVHRCASELPAAYLHIAEGAPVLSHIKADNKTGKLIAYLVADFIKGRAFPKLV